MSVTVKHGNCLIEVMNVWLRFYIGETSDKRRLWCWTFQGFRNVNYGVTLRFYKERCIGVQYRKLRPEYESDDIC